MSFWDTLDPRYRVILCDIWGVVHDGKRPYAGAVERMLQWRREGRRIVLITNAPRPREAVEDYLAQVAVPLEAWDAISSSGEAGIAALSELARPVGLLGTEGDRSDLEDKGVQIAEQDDFADLCCTGFEEGRWEIEDYTAHLERWAARGVRMH